MTSSVPAGIVSDPAHGTEKLLELVVPKLRLVEEELRKNFASKVRTIDEVGDHILQGGGKRLRPTLLLLVSKMLGYEGPKDVIYASVIELIHTATLVHDDIIDEAAVRRGMPSVNYGWGNNLTVLVGDYLYTHSMNMALIEGNLDILRLLSNVTIRMIEGEILALEQNGGTEVSIDDYFEVLGRKTAGIFGACCRIPGILVEAPDPVVTALQEYGYNLGVCFQLIDDLLDFTSSTEVLGKPALSDLKEGKITLPLILTLPHATAAERRAVERVVADRSFGRVEPAEIVRIVERHDGVEQTREFARDYARRAHAALSIFPPSPAREALDSALSFVQNRNR